MEFRGLSRGFCGRSIGFKILISIVAIEFAINTNSMEFLGHPAWNSVDSCGQELTDSMD